MNKHLGKKPPKCTCCVCVNEDGEEGVCYKALTYRNSLLELAEELERMCKEITPSEGCCYGGCDYCKLAKMARISAGCEEAQGRICECGHTEEAHIKERSFPEGFCAYGECLCDAFKPKKR